MNKHFLFVFLILTIQLKSFCSQRNCLILEGLEETRLGWELDIKKFHSKILFSGGKTGRNHYLLLPKLHLGVIFPRKNNFEIIPNLSFSLSFEQFNNYKGNTQKKYNLIPSCNITVYKIFNKFIIGATIGLEFYEYNWRKWSYEKEYSLTGYQGLNVVPNFVFGYEF